VVIQVRPKPNARYRILGLAIVAGWEEGYFLDGFSAAQKAREGADYGKYETSKKAQLITLAESEPVNGPRG
jgi:hypothetical protein